MSSGQAYVGATKRTFQHAVRHLLETDYGLMGSRRVLELLAFQPLLACGGIILSVDSQVLLRQWYADLQQQRDLTPWEALAVQMHHAHKGLDVTLYGRYAVMSMQGNLVVGLTLQPPPDDLGFVGLPTPDAVQFAPGGQIDPLGLQIGKIPLDGANGNLYSAICHLDCGGVNY